MPLVASPRPLDRQPQFASPVNRNHWLAEVFTHAFIPGVALGVDQLGNAAPIPFGVGAAAPGFGVIRHGRVITQDGGDTSSHTAAGCSGSAVYPIVMAACGYFNSSAANWNLANMLRSGTAGGDSCALRIATSTAVSYVIRHNFGSTSTVTVTTGAGTNTGLLITMVSVSHSATDHRLWANGVAGTGVTDVGAIPTVFDKLAIGGSTFLNGGELWVAYGLGRRAPTDQEALALSKDPALFWRLFEDEPQRVWVPATTGIAFDVAGNSGAIAADNDFTGSASWAGTDRFLAVDVTMLGPGVTVSSMTYGGAACTFIGAISTVTSFGRVEQWRIASSDSGAPAAGSNTLVVNLSGTLEFSVVWASYTGVHQSSPTEGFNSAQATNAGVGNDATVNVTSVADNCWIHAACAANDTAITAGNTSRNNVSGTLGSGANEDNGAPKTPAGSVAMSYSGMGITTTWAIAGYAIRPVAASGLALFIKMIAARFGLAGGKGLIG